MNRKKITTIAACLIMALSLTACGSQTSQPGQRVSPHSRRRIPRLRTAAL